MANEARQRRILDRVVGDSGSAYPTAPAAAMLNSISWFISTAYTEFWVRIGNASKQLHGDDMIQYRDDHWG